MLSDKSMFESDFIRDWLDTKKELEPISSSSIADHKERQETTRKAKLRSKGDEKTTFKDKVKNTRQRRQKELEATTNMLETTNEGNTSSVLLNTHPNDNKVIPLPRGHRQDLKHKVIKR